MVEESNYLVGYFLRALIGQESSWVAEVRIILLKVESDNVTFGSLWVLLLAPASHDVEFTFIV